MTASPSFDCLLLRDAAPLLPPDHGWHAALATDQSDEAAAPWVLRVRGDLELASLDLQRALAAGGPLHELLPDTTILASGAQPRLLLVCGTLRITGSLIDHGWGDPLALCVLGDLHCTNALLGQAAVQVQGTMHVADLLWGEGNGDAEHAPRLTIAGDLHARLALFTEGYRVRMQGTPHLPLPYDTREPLAHLGTEALLPTFQPGYVDRLDPGTEGLPGLIDQDTVLAALRAGQSVLQPGNVPPPAMPAPDAAPPITLAHLHQLIRTALPDKSRRKAQGWWAQTDFLITRRHVDEDGDTFHDGLFLTEWKAWDFWFSDQPEPEALSLVARAAAWITRRPPPAPAGFTRLYRAYTLGQPGPWLPMDGPDAAVPAEALQACDRAWRGVHDYWRKAAAQRQAGFPLRQRLLAQITPSRIEALTLLPVFTEEYDDWWDGDRNGWWEDDLWVGARQPCERHGKRWGRALKLSWENGENAPGDEDDDAHASYQIDLDRDATSHSAVRIGYTQRQSDARVPLPPEAVDHTARLLRLFEAIEQRLHAAHDQRQAEEADTRRIEAQVQLLAAPPFDPQAPDAAVFPAALQEASDSWQTAGRHYVAAVRQRIERNMARTEATGDGDADGDVPPETQEAPWPIDARKAQAPTLLQLARVVSRHADADLAARFHRRFAFAPDAFTRRAAQSGQSIGPVLLLPDGSIAARIGPEYADDAHWQHLSADGLTLAPLPGVHGLGRSPDGACFAVSDRTRITTHAGWQGPVIAELPLPRGDEGLPAALGLQASADHSMGPRCDQLIAFDGGQGVLLRNPTGIYRIDAAGVQRLHPQTFDADGPYTWPKNQRDGLLHLDMLHMALSPDGQRIAVGDQDSGHVLLDAQGRVLRTVEPRSSYPHQTWFTHDGSRWMANACHLYQGDTVMADPYAPRPADGSESGEGNDSDVTPIGMGWRIYAAAVARGLSVVGDAQGYLHGLDDHGQVLWHHHVGSSISGMDVSPDGRTIVAGSHGGYLVVLRKGTGPDPFTIGTSRYSEARRFIFWTDEAAPIRW